MSKKRQQTLDDANQTLDEIVNQIRSGDSQADLLPTLESVLTQIRELVQHDHLTGALNRRGFIEILEDEVLRSSRTGEEFTLAIIGIDQLEEILEGYGQTPARQVLKFFSQIAHTKFRRLDSVGRITANEFAVLMPGTWGECGRQALTIFQEKLDEFNWRNIVPELRVSFSTGITHYTAGDDVEKILARASLALKHAREHGQRQFMEALA